MTVDVQVETTIGRPVADVATFAGDPTNAPLWYTNIRSVTWKTPPPSLWALGWTSSPRSSEGVWPTYEVVELEPHRRLVMRTADGPFPMETTYTWEATGT